jgi:TPR repeat protein
VKAIILAALLLQAAPLAAYPLVKDACKDDPQACVKAGKLEFVSIYGRIGDEDLNFFTMLDENLPPDAPFPRIFVNSYGGKVGAGLGIGRILHKHQATVESGSPVISDPAPQCSSACALLAQGALHRRLSHVGLHSPSRRVKTDENVWETQAGSLSDIKAYMTEMGASAETTALIEKTSFDEFSNLYYAPKLPLTNQPIYKLQFYDRDDAYFTKSNFDYSGDFSFQKPEEYMISAANYGSIQAMRDLSEYYTTDDLDVKPNFEASSRWLKMAADKGDAMSIHNLAYHYNYGLGVAQDDAKAAELYLKAAKLGVAASQNNLGWAYYTGVGVTESLPDAIYWITKSAEQGEAFAYGSLCEISGTTALFRNDPAEAVMWCGLAVEHLTDGNAKEAAQAVYDEIRKTVSSEVLANGAVQIQRWDAEHVTTSMRNVGDDLN